MPVRAPHVWPTPASPPGGDQRRAPEEKEPGEARSGRSACCFGKGQSNATARETGGLADQNLCDTCGDDLFPPHGSDNGVRGIVSKVALPALLGVSTVLMAVCVWHVQVPLLHDHFQLPNALSKCIFFALYGITLGLMAYCALADPGQLRRDKYMMLESGGLPLRAHKSWQYSRPIRRYDHYCRWVANCIGLLNHREFFVMVCGFVSIAAANVVVDGALALRLIREDSDLQSTPQPLFVLTLHLCCSSILMYVAWPILRIHIGLVSRNELAAEWKHNVFYVAASSKRGAMVRATDLSDEEYNVLFDDFIYEPTLNRWDNGFTANWWDFWCVRRWRAGELGDF